ncbi:MAG: hypothetical protein AAFQ33_17320, partial [Pseudomonadota bacterium]
MTTRYIATVPVQGKDDKTRFTRVGVMWENTRNDTGEVFFKLELDFPVGAKEIVLFPPKDAPADQN